MKIIESMYIYFLGGLKYRAAPVTLPEFGMEFQNGDQMQVSGWGTLSSGGDASDELRMVTVPFVSDEGISLFHH